MMDFKAKPFYLQDEDIQWVQATLSSMDVREKVGQLFCLIGVTDQQDQLKQIMDGVKPGGFLFRPGQGQNRQSVHRFLQDNSTIPLLIAANLEAGGNGIAEDGTYFGKSLQVAATDSEEMAYKLGLVTGREGRAVGCNWAFAPVVDIDFNFRNPITNVRSFGSDPARVARMAKAFSKGIQESGLAVSIKHFPGDGVDDRDQHLHATVNSLSVNEWNATFGMAFKEQIDAGAKTVMAGHILLPAYSRELVPGISDTELMPATLAPELLGSLLRDKLGFNGLIVTDATPMAGFTMAERREIALPRAIAAGCDIVLYNRNIREDVQFMMNGLASGILTMERLNEAVTRILALKASLGLHKQQREGTLVPGPEALSILRCSEHESWAKACADQSVTLVKDNAKLLPLNKEMHKRILLYVLGDEGSKPAYPRFVERMEAEGFEIHVYDKKNVNYAETMFGSISDFKAKYDLALYFANVETASNRTVVRINWVLPVAADMPWFIRELPTAFVSVSSPYHLQDVPSIPTFINAYSGSEYVIDAVVDKLTGKSAFKGVNPVDPFCGYWEARL